MKKEEIINILKQANNEVQQKYKAKVRGIFGSDVRGEEHGGSDVDVLVEFEKGSNLLHFVGLSLFLEERIGIKVDFVPFDTIRKEIKRASFERGCLFMRDHKLYLKDILEDGE